MPCSNGQSRFQALIARASGSTSGRFRPESARSTSCCGAVQATERDPRVTRIGGVMRATAMDELPQLWNIFVGDMSFVGPRALRPGEIETGGHGEHIAMEDIPGYRERHSVRPGLTGVAQIFAPRDVPRRHKFKYDRIYINRQTFALDMRLILLSFWITFRGKWEHRKNKL
jgi:lipopolysaccharide/colanic/teichoic acid biosynthesis glycosyltransferase